MKLKLKTITAFTLSLLFTVSLSGVVIVNAQIMGPIVVTTDKSSYTNGEKVVVSGQVNQLLSGVPVGLQILSPSGVIVQIAQISVNTDKIFNYEFTSGGTMKESGTYTINALYGSPARTASVTFSFTATSSSTTEKTGVLSISGHKVSYTMTGGTVSSGFADQSTTSIIIFVNTSSDGTLELQIPRTLLDSKLNGNDGNFFVLVDAEEVKFDETKTSNSRTLTIALPAGTEEVEVIGSSIFGSQQFTTPTPNQAPVLQYTISPSTRYAGESIQFDARNSYDPDGSIVKYEWYFGDGASSFSANAFHTYSVQMGTTGQVKITDDDGKFTSQSFTITVLPSKSVVSTGNESSGTQNGIDMIWIAVGIGAAAAAGGAVFAMSKRKKIEGPIQTTYTPSSPSTQTSDTAKGRTCNVCGTNIPKGVSVCPSCGDTYSV